MPTAEALGAERAGRGRAAADLLPVKEMGLESVAPAVLLDLAAARAAVGLDVEALAGRAALGVRYVA